MFVKVTILPDGAKADVNDPGVDALIFLGPGVYIVPVTERGVKKDRSKLVFPDGRAVVLDHSFTYMEALIMGQHQRPGLISDVDKQLGSTGKAG